MSKIKHITVTTTEQEIALGATYQFAWFRNNSDVDIIVSDHSDIVEDADDTEIIKSNDVGRITITNRDKVYAKAVSDTAKIDVHAQNFAASPFKRKAKGGESVTVTALNVTENDTYIAPSGTAYSPVTVNVPTGAEIITRSAWNALTTAQKKAKGLVAIQDASTGFKRGEFVNGADYRDFEVITSGTASYSAELSIDNAGVYQLFVIAMNSEASTKNLTISATQDDTPITGTNVDYNIYGGSADNVRNYRIVRYDLDIDNSADIGITLSEQGGFSALVYVLIKADTNTFDKAISKADTYTSGVNTKNGFVLYGTFNGYNGGTINAERYNKGATVSTENPGTSYKSSYIFWFAW